MILPTNAMTNWIESAVAAHRELEALLDILETAICSGEFIAEFRAAERALRAHYGKEDVHWRFLAAAKMVQQHEEVLELANGVEEALGAGHSQDGMAIVKRFIALASHNLIEEERDWFPLV